MALETVVTPNSMSHWNDILREWVQLNDEIYRMAAKAFAPYSYRERPNVSALAGAATRKGWVALEECWLSKADAVHSSYDGRADLMLWKAKHSCIVEAKLTCDGFSQLPGKIAKRRASARAEAEKTLWHKASEHIALTFVVPRFLPDSDYYSGCEALVGQCCDLVRSSSSTMLAAVFPGVVQRRTADRGDEGMASAGVILLGEVVSA